MENIARWFSFPTPETSKEVFDYTSQEVGKKLISKTCSRLPLDNLANLKELCEFLCKEITPQRSWLPWLGKLHKANMANSITTAEWGLIEAGMNFACSGAVGKWSFSLDQPATFRIGRWGTVDAVAGDVCSSEEDFSIRIRTSYGSNASIESKHLADSQAMNQIEPLVIEIFAVSNMALDGNPFLLPSNFLEAEIFPVEHSRQHPEATYLDCKEYSQILTNLSKMKEIMLGVCPEYLQWITSAVSYISPIKHTSGIMVSGSREDIPGVVALVDDPRPLALGEMLVHEASHQYLFLAKRLGIIQDPEHTKLHFSPVTRCERPIENILLAYHAFANIVLYYNACISSYNADKSFCQKQLEFLANDVVELRKTLLFQKGLTPFGEAIFHPLMAREEKVLG